MLKTIKAAFGEYQDKMNLLSNSLIAESICLDKLSTHCRTVAAECQNVAGSLHKLSNNTTYANGGLFGDVATSSLTLQ
jgi:hypothetical protein